MINFILLYVAAGLVIVLLSHARDRRECKRYRGIPMEMGWSVDAIVVAAWPFFFLALIWAELDDKAEGRN